MRALAATLLLSGCIASTTAMADSGSGTCPASASDMSTEMLYGTWQVRFDDAPAIAIVTLGKHPDYDGVRGTITRDGARSGDAALRSVAQLAGDIDAEGQLAIDESQDGRSISGVWDGTLQPGSCGEEFRGTWRNVADESTHPFVLRKTGTYR
ncbi:MAG: hypothetical protein H7340_09640 [Variovorax sp.]|nr:hypothetical protein [Variovorax sp.]